ncbi:hypothetical protein AAG906_003248 [Vitis piasezkii]
MESLSLNQNLWGIDINGKISPKSYSGHEFILVAIDYFTKWLISDTLLQRYGIQHHRSSTYKPQTNGAIKATNKNIKRILRRMVETFQDCSEKLPFALWVYQTSFCTSIGLIPYSLVYGMEAVLPVEIEMGSLRVALEQGDLVLKVIKGLIRDPRGKFRPNWSGPYFIRELTPESAAWLMDLDGNRFLESTNVDQLKKYYV